MAFCPQCRKEIEARAIACPHCGYDFGASAYKASADSPGLAFSRTADVFLILGIVVVGFIGALAVLRGLITIFRLELANFLVAFFQFSLCVAVLIVFVRVSSMKRSGGT